MNRRILIQVTTPGVIIGLLLFLACLGSAWYIDRLQSDMAKVLSRNVTSLQAAQELEIQVHRLRFYLFLNILDPKSEARQSSVDQDHERFEDALRKVCMTAHTSMELTLVAKIERVYGQYKEELAQIEEQAGRQGTPVNLSKWAEQHPISNVIQPCEALLDLSRDTMKQTSEDNSRVSRQVRWLMILLGFVGPISGLLVGFAVARGLSRSIYQLSVRVQDMARATQLDQDVAAVSIQADGDMQNLDRQLQQVVARVEDVTERFERQQREMLRAEQLSAVGQLAASVAHEVRNPLTSMKMLVEAAQRARNPKPLSAEDLKVIHGEIARLEDTVQSFLDFARLPSPKRCRCELRQIIKQALDLIQARARQQKVEVITDVPEQVLDANVDQDQICNVLVNLFLNALDAMPQEGQLEVKLAESPDGARQIEIADTGPGISADILPRLFTPFTSSKPTGTGLGLSICRRIVEEHGGTISAWNRPEGGACFLISLASVDNENSLTPGADATRLAADHSPLTTHHSPTSHVHTTGH
jgi:signal transduction histidine kinase